MSTYQKGEKVAHTNKQKDVNIPEKKWPPKQNDVNIPVKKHINKPTKNSNHSSKKILLIIIIIQPTTKKVSTYL